jgi:hypothetical protein
MHDPALRSSLLSSPPRRRLAALGLAIAAAAPGCAATAPDDDDLAPPAALAGAAPTVAFTRGGDRQLIFVNNPEQITDRDLGDADRGDASILRVTGVQGAVRSFWEHTNRTGRPLGYAVMIYNPSPTAVSVVVHGRGFTTGFLGGKPFSDLLGDDSRAGTRIPVAAGAVLWLDRRDASVPDHAFFSGVIDFDVEGGPVTVDHIAYDQFSRLDSSRTYQGYLQRVEPDSTRVARQYKGTSPYSEVTASDVDFTITDADRGALPVVTRDYDLTAGAPGAPVTRTYWISHIGPGQNAQAVTSDMLAWETPGWGRIDPLTRSDGEGKYPNLGNWGVVYIVRGTVRNAGTLTRDVSVNVEAPANGGSPIAYRGNDGTWRHLKLAAGTSARHYTLRVPAGQAVRYEARFILGGPGAGSLKNWVSVNH